jgi:HEAT repeat protein
MFRGLLTLVLVMAPVAAAAAPLATADADLDGDGNPDALRLEDGTLTATLGAGGRVIERALPGAADAIGADIASQNDLVVVTVREPGGAMRAHALRLDRRAWKPVWSGPVGPVGPDGEYQVHVIPTARGELLELQSRPGYTRCGVAPSYLFPRKWDGARFRPVINPVAVPDYAPVLTATTEPPAAVAADAVAVVFRAAAASHQLGARNAGELVPPREIDDGDPATAWREGMGGIGHGEFVTARTRFDDAKVVALRLVPGDAASEEAFRRHNRLRRIGLEVGQRSFWVEWPEDPARRPTAAWWVALPEPVPADCVSVIIDEVYRGAAGADTAIAELAIFTELDLTRGGIDAVLAARVAAGEAGWQSAARTLEQRGTAGARALAAEAEKPDQPGPALVRLRRTLAALADPVAIPALVAGLASDPIAEDRAAYAAALGRMGAGAVPALTELMASDERPTAARVAAADALAMIDTEAADAALWDGLGAGPRPLRAHLARTLAGRAQPAAVIAAIDAARQAGNLAREADLWRLAGILAAGAHRDLLAPAIAERLAGAGDYELRYRLLEAAAPLAAEPTLVAVGAALSGTGTGNGGARADDSGARTGDGGARAEALRRVAAAGLARNPDPRARALLLELAADRDPGLRLAVTRGLGSRRDADAASDVALIARLDDDPWPMIRRTAAGVLAPRCTAEPPADALRRSIAGDDSVQVRLAALAALWSCRGAELGPYLLDLVADTGQKSDVRSRAAALAGQAADPELVPRLIDLLGKTRGESLASEDARRVAQAVAGALGATGDPRAVEPLLSAARDSAFPGIQTAAVRALARTCAREALPLFRQLSTSEQPALRRAASDALRSCGPSR